MLTLNKYPQKNNWNADKVQLHMEPSPITLIKSKNDDKSDKYFGKIKLHRDPMSENSNLYEF